MHLYGLTGFPLKNSFSEKFFADKFREEGLSDHAYKNFPAATVADISDIFNNNRNVLRGLNVTIPHKQNIIGLLDETAEDAASVGAVNCVRIDSSGYKKGYNTDVYGFRSSLLPLLKPWHQKALVLGTGGASLAVRYVLQNLGISYTLVSRSPEAALPYTEIDKPVIRAHQVIINCTPLGMFPDKGSFPQIPYGFVTDMHLAYDLVYIPEETLFLKYCRAQGATVKNGLEMLRLQAEKSWEIWQSSK